jgi:cell division septation protein DedD
MFFFQLSPAAFGGNLSLIEKRLIELDTLHKQAVKEAGELPENGSVEIETRVKPGVNPNAGSGIGEKRFEFSKKNILAIDEKLPFTVQISSSRSQQQCYRVAAMLRRTGYPSFTASITLKDQEVWHRIFVGSFATREEAEFTRQSLEKDEISDGMIRNMPYAVQIGSAGTLESFKTQRDRLAELQHMPYTGYVRETGSNQQLTRLLIGAFETKEDTANLLTTLRREGLTAMVVER